MIEFLISKFKGDHKVAVLSRGYRRKSKGFQLAHTNSTVEELGDEPFQIHKKYPGITVAVDGNRQNGIARLEQEVKPSLILLDDAFQHRKVTPTFSVLLTTFSNPYYSDWYLPTGNLRDSKSAAKRADIIVVTKCPSQLDRWEMQRIRERIRPGLNQELLFSSLRYDSTLYGPDNMDIGELRDIPFTLVTGIANPAPLVLHLKGLNLTFEHLKFPDHHNFTIAEVNELLTKDMILTTEKDYTRLRGRIKSLYFIKVEHQFLADGEKRLMEIVSSRS